MKTAPLNFAIFCMVLFCANLKPLTAAAQESSPPHTSTPLQEWKAADEITFAGSISEVVSKNIAGSPLGLNLLMNGSRQTLYVNLGRDPGNSLKRLLSPGQAIQVVGIARTINGQNYLLARELKIDNQTIEVRNSHGFLVHTTPPGTTPSTNTRIGGIGGAK